MRHLARRCLCKRGFRCRRRRQAAQPQAPQQGDGARGERRRRSSRGWRASTAWPHGPPTLRAAGDLGKNGAATGADVGSAWEAGGPVVTGGGHIASHNSCRGHPLQLELIGVGRRGQGGGGSGTDCAVVLNARMPERAPNSTPPPPPPSLPHSNRSSRLAAHACARLDTACTARAHAPTRSLRARHIRCGPPLADVHREVVFVRAHKPDQTDVSCKLIRTFEVKKRRVQGKPGAATAGSHMHRGGRQAKPRARSAASEAAAHPTLRAAGDLGKRGATAYASVGLAREAGGAAGSGRARVASNDNC